MRQLSLLLVFAVLLTSLAGCISAATQITSDWSSSSTASTNAPESSTAAATTTKAPATTPFVTEEPPITEPEPPDTPEGTGSLTALKLQSADNATLAADLAFTVDEEARTATLTLNYQTYADRATLTRAVLSATADGGEVSFPALTEDGKLNLLGGVSCWVTDENGWVKVYKLQVDRTVYQLPIINITLEDGKAVNTIDRDLTTKMTFSMDCTGYAGYPSVGNVSGTIRGRGNSTWKWDKKPYKIKLDEKESLLGMDDNRDWILLANYADKSLIRNTLAYEMGRVLDNLVWSPHSYPVDLFVNGQYQGVYALGEHMEVANGRVDLEEGSTDPDTDYLLEIGGMAPTGDVNGVHYFHTDGRLVRFATFKSPDFEEITDEQKKFITEYFQKTEDAIISGEGYEKYIDVDSFIDWIIIHELGYNIDSCFRRSCFLVKEKGGKLRMGPIWDFDLAFGNFSRDNKKYDDWVTIGQPKTGDETPYVQYNWCTYLMKDKEFCDRLAARWAEVRDELLRVANETIDTYGALLNGGSQQENYIVWKVWGVRTGYQSKWCMEANTFEKQLQYLRDFLKKRAEWMDKAIPKLPT